MNRVIHLVKKISYLWLFIQWSAYKVCGKNITKYELRWVNSYRDLDVKMQQTSNSIQSEVV